MDNEIIEKTKQHFLDTIKATDPASMYPYLPRHVIEVEKWAKKLLQKHPEADKEITLLSVWLHDIGQAIGNKDDDHAVKSGDEANRFLPELGLDKERIEKVFHCVRAHRCKDVQPETIEAKILAVADSATHMTDINYIVHLSDKSGNWGRSKEWVLEKLERDYRDIGLFPEFQKEIRPLYEAWKQLLNVYPDKL